MSTTQTPVDPAFSLIPQNSTFFYIWRIEKLQVIAVPKENYGQFYGGDSYIVICATDGKERADSQLKPREVRTGLDIHIHFWLGSQTSQDEAGIAAYKSVELDDYLGGTPVQHRETQGHESKRFLSYFRNGMRILKGGIESGFNKVDISLKPSLYQVKGKRAPIVRQLSEINWNQLNDGDVFIVDACSYIYVWTGQYANNMEKIQAIKVAQELKSEHAPECHAIVVVEDNQEHKELSAHERQVFEQYLPLNEKKVLSHTEVPNDTKLELNQRSEIILYRCSDEDQTLKVSKVKTGPLEQSDLNSNDSFIVDNNSGGLWVWVGKKASAKERTESMRNAQGFIVKKGYPEHTRVTRVIDGGEPIEFRNLFKSWKDDNQTNGFGNISNVGKITKVIPQKFDPSVLHENHVMAAETQMVDDGNGQKQVYRVKDFDLVEVPKQEFGKFYSGDCYLVVYTYGAGNVIIYYWLGSKSSVDEKGTAAMKTVDFDNNKYNGSAVQVRVVEGKEPAHFMAIFSGKMVILMGGFSSGFNNNESSDGSTNTTHLLQVRGTNQYNTKAIEVQPSASSLNSNDVFVLLISETAYVWAGKGSLGDEREMAKSIAEHKGKEVSLVSEGQENSEFWDAIGGKQEYSNDKKLQISDDPHSARLFQCSNASGKFTVEEIPNFDQSDLIQDDVMLLDAWDALFIWIGDQSNREERKQALEAVQQYLNTDPSGRDTDTPIIVIKQGYEPINFTGFFGVWDNTLWNKNNNYEDIKSSLRNGNSENVKIIKANNVNNILSTDFGTVNKYPIEKLMVKEAVLLPEDVEPTRKEIYLSESDFKQVFGLSYKEFQAIPKWKQLDLKKKFGLF